MTPQTQPARSAEEAYNDVLDYLRQEQNLCFERQSESEKDAATFAMSKRWNIRGDFLYSLIKEIERRRDASRGEVK